jgi:peptidoglycan hydrolase-like protein with peptidoglycan-binding domain
MTGFFILINIYKKVMKLVITESQMYKIVRHLNEEESKEQKVKKIQQFLVDNGYDLGDYGDNEDGVDGEYGGLTRKAVKEFQRKKGLEDDGKVGPKTAEAM